jgi:hypothetical protein
MVQEHLEFEAPNLEEARRDAELKIQQSFPKGKYSMKEQVLSDGRPRTIHSTAATIDAAYAEAEKQLSSGDVILAREALKQPVTKLIQVEGFDETEARAAALRESEKDSRIESIAVAVQGKKGFLGIGRTAHRYDVSVICNATVEIQCRRPARIRVTLEEEIPTVHIDPRAIKLIATFSIGFQLPDNDPWKGPLLAFGVVNKELLNFLIDRKLAAGIPLVHSNISAAAEADATIQALLKQLPGLDASRLDVYHQTAHAKIEGKQGHVILFTAVTGSGHMHNANAKLMPR